MVLLLASLFAAGCGTSVPPSDGEMIRLFRTHEAAFNHVYEIISEKTEGSHYYPPSEFDSIFIRELAAAEGLSCGLQGLYGEDSSYLHGLFPPDRALLDSLLAVTGCELVRFYRRVCGEDSVELSLTMVHYSHGLSVSGTAKCFVCPRLEKLSVGTYRRAGRLERNLPQDVLRYHAMRTDRGKLVH